MITRAAEAEAKDATSPPAHPAPAHSDADEPSPKKPKVEPSESEDSLPRPSPKSKAKAKATGQVKDDVKRRTVKVDKRVHRSGQAKAGEEPPTSLVEITGEDMNRRHGALIVFEVEGWELMRVCAQGFWREVICTSSIDLESSTRRRIVSTTSHGALTLPRVGKRPI